MRPNGSTTLNNETDWGKKAIFRYLNMAEEGPLNNYPYNDPYYVMNFNSITTLSALLALNKGILWCYDQTWFNKSYDWFNRTYDTAISYNFGNISSDKEKDGYSDKSNNYMVVLETFKTTLACPLAENVQTYTWEKLKASASTYEDVNYLTYGDGTQHVTSDVSKPGTGETWSVLNYIKGTNKIYNEELGNTLNFLLSSGSNKRYLYVDVQLISKATGKEDYFKASVTRNESEKTTTINFKALKTDDANNPAQDVPSTLVFTVTDGSFHKHKIEMPFTVKRR